MTTVYMHLPFISEKDQVSKSCKRERKTFSFRSYVLLHTLLENIQWSNDSGVTQFMWSNDSGVTVSVVK
jgi:hypothetical protein